MKILKIKPLETFQVSEIVVLDRICLGGIWTAEGYLREINSPNSSLLTLSFWDEETKNTNSKEKIVGVACLWSILEEAHITLLGIHPDFRQQGLGTLLLLSLLEDAISRNLSRATLEVNVNNIKAINLYRKIGFEIAGKRRRYYQSTGEDALVLWLNKLQNYSFKKSLAEWQKDLESTLGKNNYCWHGK